MDADVTVRTLAFQAIDFSYHYWPDLTSTLNENFYKNMAEKMVFNPD